MSVKNLTTEATLRQAAEQWLDRNGEPSWIALDRAIKFSAAHGDPNLDNPFREALMKAAAERYGWGIR